MSYAAVNLAINIIGAASAFAAAALWWYASFQKVRITQDEFENGEMAIVIEDGVEFLATAKRQTYWNGWAALAASIAAVCQGISILL